MWPFAAQLRQVARQHGHVLTCLQSVPGVGEVVATTFMLELFDPKRFHNCDVTYRYPHYQQTLFSAPPKNKLLSKNGRYLNSQSLKIAVYGDDNMTNIDKLDDDEVIKIAQTMGYDQKKSEGLEKYKDKIFGMDQWDVSKILFFGTTWEKY